MSVVEDRCILECFYGPLWTPERREAVIASLSSVATGYVYGPAADPRTGRQWREPYGDEGAHLDRLVETCRALGLTATWRVSPGAPLARGFAMLMEDPDEHKLLEARIRDMASRGFDRILVAFDDLDPALPSSTQGTFGRDPHPIAAAHATVFNRAFEAAQAQRVEFLACPTHYWGLTPTMYRQRLADLVHPEVVMIWTGEAVVSASVTTEQAVLASHQYGHKIWLWDNYPVNDWTGFGDSELGNDVKPRRIPLAPLRGRQVGLGEVIAGYGTNAALTPMSGVPAMHTALTWASAPGKYDCAAAFEAGLGLLDADVTHWTTLAAVAGAQPVGGEDRSLIHDVAARLASSSDASTGLFERLSLLANAATAVMGTHLGEFDEWLSEVLRQVEAARIALEILNAADTPAATQIKSASQLRNFLQTPPNLNVADSALMPLITLAEGLGGVGTPPWADMDQASTAIESNRSPQESS